MNKIATIENDQSKEDENAILEIYNSAIKNLDVFIKTLFNRVLEEGG